MSSDSPKLLWNSVFPVIATGSLLLFSKLKIRTSLSLSSYCRCSSPLTTLMALLWVQVNSSISFFSWGTQSCTSGGPHHSIQYSVEGENMVSGGRITSFKLLALLFLMQPKIGLAFWATVAHCWLTSNFSATATQKSFSAAGTLCTYFYVHIFMVKTKK